MIRGYGVVSEAMRRLQRSRVQISYVVAVSKPIYFGVVSAWQAVTSFSNARKGGEEVREGQATSAHPYSRHKRRRSSGDANELPAA